MKLNESSQAASAETNPSGVTAAVQATPDTITNRARLLSGSRNSSGRSDSSKSRSALNKFVSMFPKMKRSKGSAASFSSQQDSDGQTDSLPSSRLNALDEDVSFYKAAEQSREPDGAASPALPPHPLDEIASARLGNAVHEVEDSWGKGSSENGFNKTIITSQDQQCVLKLSFHLQVQLVTFFSAHIKKKDQVFELRRPALIWNPALPVRLMEYKCSYVCPAISTRFFWQPSHSIPLANKMSVTRIVLPS